MSQRRFWRLVVPKARSHARAPSPAIFVAALALVAAMTGAAVAGDKSNADKDEVTVVTTTGGPVDVIDPDIPVEITLTDPSFTQTAGEAVLLTATIEVSYPDREEFSHGCDVFVDLFDPTTDGTVGFTMVRLWERGAFGDTTGTTGVSAPTSDTLRTLTVLARIGGSEGSSCAFTGDVYTVSVRVSIVTYRN